MISNIWIKDLSVLINKDKILEFVPTEKMTYEEKINSIVRFSLYLSILLSLLKGDLKYLYIFIITLAITYIIYIFNKKNNKEEVESEDNLENFKDIENSDTCVKPKPNNLFMNFNIADNFKENKTPCKYTEKVNKYIDTNFNKNLFKDASTIFNEKSNQRQFYTMPNNQPANERKELSKWLYLLPESCDDNNILEKKYRRCNNKFNYN